MLNRLLSLFFSFLWGIFVRTLNMWELLSSFLFTRRAPTLPEDDLPPAKVAIIGTGMGGSFAAKFLRENGGKKLDIHMFSKKGSKIGGRTGVCLFHNHIMEEGASFCRADSKYVTNIVKKHGLSTKTWLDDQSFGIFNGSRLLTIYGRKMLQSAQLFWRYGFDIFRMHSYLKHHLKQFVSIYTLQENGKAFTNIYDMLDAMGGKEMRDQMHISADDYFRKVLGWSDKLIEEIVMGTLNANYGQGTNSNAFTAIAALAAILCQDSLWSVVGGNFQMAECALRDSGYTSLVKEDVVSVTKTEEGGSPKYTVVTEDGTTEEGFDVVIVANPLNMSTIKYNNFSNEVYTAGATTPYHRSVVNFFQGKINQQFFGEKIDHPNFPQCILATNMKSPPFEFSVIWLEVPGELRQDEMDKFQASIRDDPASAVWRVFTTEPMTRDQILSLLPDIDPDDTHHIDWLAYPEYLAPYRVPPFVLDDGVFYINAIEMSVSFMEMAVIGGKNASLLARDYLLKKK